MIIWRGWGVIGFAFPALGAIAGAAIGSAIGSGDPPSGLIGICVILGAIAAFLLGYWLNDRGVETKLDRHLASRREQLNQLVHAGQFQLAPGVAQPRSHEEAQQQIETVLANERQELRPGLRNRHTLFFIPVQWFSVLVALVALGLIIAGLVGN